MRLMTLNLFSYVLLWMCNYYERGGKRREAENTIFMWQRRFGQGDELAIIGIRKLRYMFCKSRKFAHEVIPEVNHEARPLLIGPSCGSDRCWRFQCHITR